MDITLTEKKKKKVCNSVTYTTGDIQKNIDFFNKRSGTYIGNDNTNPSTEEAKAEAAADAANSAVAGGEAVGAGESCGMSCGESSGGMGESLEEGGIMTANKIGKSVELPAQINILDQRKVTEFVMSIGPEERFKVGYITPIYFYKELWDKFTLFKCTEFVGYTGIDYRDVRSDNTTNLDKAREEDSGTDELQHGQFNVVSRTVDQRYGQRNKTVMRKDHNTKEYVDFETILFYPDPQIAPKVSYFIDLKNGMGALKTDKETLEKTIFAKVHEIADTKIKDAQLKAKIDKVFDTDNATVHNVNLDPEAKKEYTANDIIVNKPQVRALYINQIYYIGDDIIQNGRLVNEDLKLTEGAPRVIKRYYIRPQNIFCSNKADILATLAQLGDENCSIYTLKNLADHDDVHKLTSKDIIYYYDDRVLYDKNHVQVLDYDLFVKHEEERKNFNVKDAEDIPDSQFDSEYEDRMTENLDEAFFCTFDDINVYGETLHEGKQDTCCICGEEIEGYGNNAEPYKKGTCCDACNIKFVIPARIENIHAQDVADED